MKFTDKDIGKLIRRKGKKKWLVCIFTYNRYRFLSNAVKSIDEFFPWGDRLVVDDGSSDLRVVDYICSLSKDPKWKFTSLYRDQNRLYGSFYHNMNYALQYALSNGYDRCFFFEDDEQFVWKDEIFLERVEEIFENYSDCIQIMPLFHRRIISYRENMTYMPKANVYRTNRGFSTTAIWNLDIVRKFPDAKVISTYGDSLPLNSAYWLKKGYRVYCPIYPTVAILPWIKSQSNTPDQEKGEPLGNGYLLKPLTSKEIKYLRNRDPHIPAFQEYFNLSKENNSGPIWHQKGNNLLRLYSLCRKSFEYPVDVYSGLDLSPLKSHWHWEPSKEKQNWLSKTIPTWLKKPLGFIKTTLSFQWLNYFYYLKLKMKLKKEIKEIYGNTEIHDK